MAVLGTTLSEQQKIKGLDLNLDIDALLQPRRKLSPAESEAAKQFSSDYVIASSAFPFRSRDGIALTPKMRILARQIWGLIFNAWTPQLAITIGSDAYNLVREYLLWVMDYEGEEYHPYWKNEQGFKLSNFKRRDNGKTVLLAGFPHFSYFDPFGPGTIGSTEMDGRQFVADIVSRADLS